MLLNLEMADLPAHTSLFMLKNACFLKVVLAFLYQLKIKVKEKKLGMSMQCKFNVLCGC